MTLLDQADLRDVAIYGRSHVGYIGHQIRYRDVPTCSVAAAAWPSGVDKGSDPTSDVPQFAMC